MTCTRIGGAIICTRERRARPRKTPVCRWPQCFRNATQAGWGCRAHWFQLPQGIRNRLWQADRDDRAVNGRRGRAWSNVADEADRWVAEELAKPPKPAWRQPELPL